MQTTFRRASFVVPLSCLLAGLSQAACAGEAVAAGPALAPTLVLHLPRGRMRAVMAAHVRVSTTPRRPATRRPAVTRRSFPLPLPPPPRPAPTLAAGADSRCLEALFAWGVPFRPAGNVRGVKSPIEITGPIRGVRLAPRAGRPPVMDCALARTLAEAAPIFRRHGVVALSFSGAYSYRNVRGTSHLSAHAYGLAIDVHAFETNAQGSLQVLRDYPRDRARWGVPRDNVRACFGEPRTGAATLRALACELRAHPAFRLIISPDDNEDHRDHLHLEAYPARPTQLLSSTGDKPAVVHRGRGGRHARP